MRILVLGANGMLGHTVVDEALRRDHRVWAWSRRALLGPLGEVVREGLEATELTRIPKWLDEIAPHVVVNAVGLIKQRPQARDLETLMNVNAWFPQALEFFTEPRGIRLIHVSTDCVFDGKRGHYRESDLPDAIDGYGRSKALGEVRGELSLTLRTSIIGPEVHGGYGLFEWLKGRQGTALKGHREAWFSGVTTFYLSRVMLDVMERYPFLHGLYHVASAPISKLALLTAIRDRFAWSIEIDGDSTIRINRTLDAARLTRTTGIRVPPWDSMIDELWERCRATANMD